MLIDHLISWSSLISTAFDNCIWSVLWRVVDIRLPIDLLLNFIRNQKQRGIHLFEIFVSIIWLFYRPASSFAADFVSSRWKISRKIYSVRMCVYVFDLKPSIVWSLYHPFTQRMHTEQSKCAKSDTHSILNLILNICWVSNSRCVWRLPPIHTEYSHILSTI